MAVLETLWTYVIPFILILTPVVYVHELGHYLVARYNDVRIEVFSVGFGPEITGWTDRSGTRWKISAIPLGGYVKFFGDVNAASMPGEDAPGMTEAERAVCFNYKRLGQRAAIVSAGPISNFIFAVIVYAVLFATFGQNYTPPVVSEVLAGSAADEAGIRAGDRIVEIDGKATDSFRQVQQIIRFNPGIRLDMIVRRDDSEVALTVTPRVTEFTDNFGRSHRIGMLGVSHHGAGEIIRHDPLSAMWLAVTETGRITVMTLEYVGQVVVGARPGNEIGGPIGIARLSGEVFKISFAVVLSFLAVLSISLGLINLFPIPVLDGGHLMFYAIEALRGKPLGARSQEYGFRIGFALVLSLLVYATWNDLNGIPQVVNFLSGLFS